MTGGQGQVGLGIALGQLAFVEAVDGAAGDELDLDAGLGGELGGGTFRHHLLPTAPQALMISFSAAATG